MYCAKSKVVELTTYICPRSCLNVIQGHAIGLAFSSKHASVCYTVKMILFVLDTKTYLWMQVCMHVTVMSICVQFACVHLRFYTWLYYGRYEVSKGKTPSSSLRSNQRAKQCQLLPTQCFHMHNVALKTQTKAQVESKTKGPTLQSPRVHLGCNLCRRMKTQRTCKRKGFPICQSNPAQLRVFSNIAAAFATEKHPASRKLEKHVWTALLPHARSRKCQDYYQESAKTIMKKFGIFEESRRVSHIFKTGGPVEQCGFERKFKYKGLTCDFYSRNQTIPIKGARSNLNKSCGCDTATNIERPEGGTWPPHLFDLATTWAARIHGFLWVFCFVRCRSLLKVSMELWSLPIRRVSNADNAFV